VSLPVNGEKKVVSQKRERLFTEAEYLLIEGQAAYKSEYIHGRIYAMSGGTPEHSQIAANIIAEVKGRLKGKPCRVYTSDLRVKVRATGLLTYPDITVVCGEPQYEGDNLLNPTVIFEVLSPSTEAEDRGHRFEHFKQIPSLQDYVLVAQDSPRIECYTRQDDTNWPGQIVGGAEAHLFLASLDCTLELAEVYDQVPFPPTGVSRD
jgi:Uma2 family endonuclease